MKEQLASEAAREFDRLVDLHRGNFPPATRMVADPLPEPDADEIRKRHTREALKGVGWLHRKERSQARERAKTAADEEIAGARREIDRKRRAHQAELDEAWQKLLDNAPGPTLAVLAQRLEADGVAAPVAVDGDEASLVVLVPDQSAIPDRMPGTTAAGNLSLRKTTRQEQRAWYSVMVSGLVIRSLRQAFAAAPGIAKVRLVAARYDGADAYGRARLSGILAGLWQRSALHGVRWDEAGSFTVLLDTATETLMNYESSGLEALDLSAEPQLAAMMDSIDITGLLSSGPAAGTSGDAEPSAATPSAPRYKVLATKAGADPTESTDLTGSEAKDLAKRLGRDGWTAAVLLNQGRTDYPGAVPEREADQLPNKNEPEPTSSPPGKAGGLQSSLAESTPDRSAQAGMSATGPEGVMPGEGDRGGQRRPEGGEATSARESVHPPVTGGAAAAGRSRRLSRLKELAERQDQERQRRARAAAELRFEAGSEQSGESDEERFQAHLAQARELSEEEQERIEYQRDLEDADTFEQMAAKRFLEQMEDSRALDARRRHAAEDSAAAEYEAALERWEGSRSHAEQRRIDHALSREAHAKWEAERHAKPDRTEP